MRHAHDHLTENQGPDYNNVRKDVLETGVGCVSVCTFAVVGFFVRTVDECRVELVRRNSEGFSEF